MVEGKTSTRVAMALMCGLAICCAVMYMTADGAEVAKNVVERGPAESVYDIGGPTSVETEDVEKAGAVYTNTPDGRMLLSSYLSNVEAEIAAEQAARERDVEAVRAQMARNMAFNEAARDKLRAAMLAKMAANAKKTKKDLNTAMRFVQKKFAGAAALQNKRNTANIARSKKLRDTIAANKAEAKKHLDTQVTAQQRAMSTLSSYMNARIDQTNKHVAANAAQIKENAKKAREDLDAAVAMFDKKVANARDEAAKGRSKLAQQLEDQDKNIRQWANNKMKIVMAETAAQFRRVREKMSEDRHHADLALKSASTRMQASLNAFTALNDKRFSSTVKDIAAAKEEAEARVQKAEMEFKAGLNTLTTTVHEQVKKMDTRVNQLTTKVDNIKTAQASVNLHVNAEMKRMIKLGDDRYAEHLKKDAELKALIDANKASTKARLDSMAANYNEQIGAVKATMKKNRAYATKRLAQESAKLYSAIAKSEAEQLKTNQDLEDQQNAANADIAAALQECKEDFALHLGNLHTVVNENDKKFEGKIDKLTGIVRANAVKNAEERQILADMMESNKKELSAAVRDAVHQGEVRMQAAETMLVDLNTETKAALNLKITSEISKLTKRANSQIEGLRLQSKEARDMMKAEVLEAVRSMADQAKKNLDAAKDIMLDKFDATFKAEAAAMDKAAEDRAVIAGQIETERQVATEDLDAAVSTMHRSLVALKLETQESIKKTNTRVDAYAAAVEKEAADVAELMNTQMTTLTGAIDAQKSAATETVNAADAESAKGFAAASDAVIAAFQEAEKKSVEKFATLYGDMAKQRSELDANLAAATKNINDEIAKQAALADSRFRNTVKDIKAARAEASADVSQARGDFATGLLALTNSIEMMDQKLTGDISVVSGVLIDHQAKQARINADVTSEIARIDELMNSQISQSVRARGKLRGIMDENKRAAHEEVEALREQFTNEITKINDDAQKNYEGASADLTAATDKMYTDMAKAQADNIYQNDISAKLIGSFSEEAQAGIAASKDDFTKRLNELADTIAADHVHVTEEFEKITGIYMDYKAVGEKDRENIRKMHEAMNNQMLAKIQDAIEQGEARAKSVADRARENLSAAKQSLLVEITDKVEAYADLTFKTVQGNYPKIADNYLSLKAYAITAEQQIVAYVGQGKGKNLSSLGDLLVNVAALSSVEAQPVDGISPAGEIRGLFSTGQIQVDNSVTKVNGLVREFVKVAQGVRERWPMGLGKYLLLKLEGSMAEKGCLQVDKVSEKSGNWVFINGHAVGLSNKLNDFESLAVRMAHYEANLAKLTGGLSGKGGKPANIVYKPPPEYPGD